MLLFDWVQGLNTRTSKNTLSNFLPQNPFAAMSSLALVSVLAVLCNITSPLMGCRCGSMVTLWQTSDKRDVVKSRTSLCLIVGYPPTGQKRACSTEKT